MALGAWRRAAQPVFDPDRLHQIAQQSSGLGYDPSGHTLIMLLQQAYPNRIVDGEPWLFSAAGGALGVMKLLYASMSEFLHIYGTPLGTQGFSGRFRIAIYDFMLAGDMWTYSMDAVHERTVTRPGEQAYLAPGQVKGYRLPAAGWMLEYGRGPIASALPFGLADAVFSMADPLTVWQTVSSYTRLTVRNLRRGQI